MAPLPLALASTLALAVQAGTFTGSYFTGDGTGDAVEWLQALDTARSQYSPNPLLQDISWLYTPTWSGFVEGPTWDAWWTQNSYGTTLAAAPWLMEPYRTFTYNANQMWFQWIGNGTRVGLDDPHPAPDGCLCDAAQPNGAYYKQGDGNVPIHDWALEESLSAVIMQAELLLIDRDPAQFTPFLPLFNRTLALIESRRDPTTQLLYAGTSSNLLAPSYGAWLQPNGTRTPAFLTGMCVSYVAALDRVIELETLALQGVQGGVASNHPLSISLASHQVAREATLTALPQLLAPPTLDYFVKWMDPNGTLHGVIGQAQHGYIEAVVNHDAVALDVADRVAGGLGEKIMARLLGGSVPPNPALPPGTTIGGPLRPYSLVTTNAGGLDDMEIAASSSWLWNYGTWVNGGEWATCEARMMLAYAKTGRLGYSLDSWRALLGYAGIFRMDSPLVAWGASVYQPDEPINTVFDMWAIPAALLRSLWDPAYSASVLTLRPHLPGNLTSLTQLDATPLRWGGVRMRLSAVGRVSMGIVGVTVNGSPWPEGLVNPLNVTFPWDTLTGPPYCTASCGGGGGGGAGGEMNFTVVFTYPPAPAAPRDASRTPPNPPHPATVATSLRVLASLLPPNPGGVWFDAGSLVERGLKEGDPVSHWGNSAPPDSTNSSIGGAAYDLTQSTPGFQPHLSLSAMNAGRPGVVFDGNSTFLAGANLFLPPTSTMFGVMLDQGTVNDCCTGVFYSEGGCNGFGTKLGADGVSSVLMIDWSGSPDTGTDDLRGRQTVVTVQYNASGAYSYTDGCLQSKEGVVGAPGSGPFMVGSRGAIQGRFFNGSLGELLVYPRELNTSEVEAVRAYLAQKWPPTHPPPPGGCAAGPPPNCTLPSPLSYTSARIARFTGGMRQAGYSEGRYELAHGALVGASVGAWQVRCAGLTQGTIPPLANRASEEAANAGYVDAAGRLGEGLENTLEGYAGNPVDSDKGKIYALWVASA